MTVIEILAYIAAGALIAFRVAMLAAFVLLPVLVVRTLRHAVVARHRGAPAAK